MKFSLRHLLPAAGATALLVATGCQQIKPPLVLTSAHDQPAAPIAYTKIDPTTAGTVTGTIHWKGAVPKRIAIDMAQDPACAFASKTPNLTEQYVVHGGGLANVFIYVQSGLGAKRYAPPTTPVVLDQKGCRYSPHVIGVMAGQPVEFRTDDPTMHNIHLEPTVPGNAAVDISQAPMGQPEQHIFPMAELMLPVRCNNHPWMEAFINVSASPFYAVSDADGHFTITGLPPGTYTLAAIHEKLPSQVLQITVPAHGTVPADFTFSR